MSMRSRLPVRPRQRVCRNQRRRRPNGVKTRTKVPGGSARPRGHPRARWFPLPSARSWALFQT
eukprot:8487458-Lingulodinium_polyedra.AAC.1